MLLCGAEPRHFRCWFPQRPPLHRAHEGTTFDRTYLSPSCPQMGQRSTSKTPSGCVGVLVRMRFPQ